jgi:hypothetical protein
MRLLRLYLARLLLAIERLSASKAKVCESDIKKSATQAWVGPTDN